MSLSSRNLYKCQQVTCYGVFVYLLVYPLFYTALYCLLFYSLFILMLLLNFCLFVHLVNKPNVFAFEAFVYHFRNTICIFVTIHYEHLACCGVFVYLLVYLLFMLHFVVNGLLLYSFFILMLLLDFCLFVHFVNKPNIFVFETFVYQFKNTICIFVTIYCWYTL